MDGPTRTYLLISSGNVNLTMNSNLMAAVSGVTLGVRCVIRNLIPRSFGSSARYTVLSNRHLGAAAEVRLGATGGATPHSSVSSFAMVSSARASKCLISREAKCWFWVTLLTKYALVLTFETLLSYILLLSSLSVCSIFPALTSWCAELRYILE